MARWADLNRQVVAAIRDGDLDAAEDLLVATWIAARDKRTLICNTHFTEGMLRDKQDRLEEAEAAFAAAVAIDRDLSPGKPALADSLHSLGIVRARRGAHLDAALAYREEATILRTTQPSSVVDVLTAVAVQQIRAERFEDANATCEEALAAIDPLTPQHELVQLHVTASEAYRHRALMVPAFTELAYATRIDGAELDDDLASAIARAWYALGMISRYGLARCQTQAAIAFWYAASLDTDMAERATTELGETRLDGDPSRWRITHQQGAITHVASLAFGLFVARCPTTAVVGQEVSVELDGDVVLAIAT